MPLFIKLKHAGKRRLVLEKQATEIADIGNSPSLKSLIFAVVTQQMTAIKQQQPKYPLSITGIIL